MEPEREAASCMEQMLIVEKYETVVAYLYPIACCPGWRPAMPLPVNTRADLDALPEAERTAFMTLLAGSIWRLERDDANQRWIAVEDLSTVSRFGFTAADFPQAPKPEFPEWRPLPEEPTGVRVVSMRQARLALLQAGLLSQVEAAIAAIEDAGLRQAVQIEWEYAAEVNRTHPWVQTLWAALGLSAEDLDALFEQAATL